jgi:3-dehydroquinate dehydratase/shikimate dehydrogenase
MKGSPAGEPTESGVVCSILEPDAAATARRLREAPAGCALVEIRADRLRAGEIAGLVRRVGRPAIVTARRTADGGGFDGSEVERRELLVAALEAGARFVDVELRGGLRDLAEGRQAERVILSWHGGPCAVAGLAALLREMAGSRSRRWKIVPTAVGPAEVAAVRATLEAARSSGGRLACFAAGRRGTASRILALAWGSWTTYGSVARGAATAEGQLTAAELCDLYDVTRIGPATRRFALVGGAVMRSPSPAMHGAAYRALGLDARYLPLEVARFDDALALAAPAGALGLTALAVTMPFKEEACRACARLDGVARRSGAVNTVLLGRDGAAGFNTDGPALLDLVRARLDPTGARVAIVGSGGAARAAAAVFAEAGARVRLYGRTPARLAAAVAAVGVEGSPLDALPAAAWDLLVQATPLGARGEVVLPADCLRGRLVLDAVYGSETPLVRDARARGIDTIDGFELLVAQAARQFEHMTGHTPDPEVLRRAGQAWLAQHEGAAAS